MTPTNSDLGYMAAMIDGEGTIFIQRLKPASDRRSPQYRVRLMVYNTSTTLMGWLIENFGGGFTASLKRKKPCYTWVVTGYRAAEILQMVEPILKIKKAKAQLAIELQSGVERGANTISDDELGRRERLHAAFKETVNA